MQLRLLNIGRVACFDDADHVIGNATLIIDDGVISWVGPAADAPPVDRLVATEVLDCGGRVVIPGLVDCHTHLVFGGNRRDEFALRAAGATYAEIHARGGGIQSTVTATRALDDDALLALAAARARRMLERGVTTIEVKSGYGLDLATELRLLRVARRVAEVVPVRVVTTFLGAHSVPKEHKSAPERYLDLVVNEMIPAVAAEGLARFCDVFCERGVFSVDASRRVLEAGLAAGLTPKLHADQLHNTGAARLGAELGAASVDHLEQVDAHGIAALAEARHTVAVLLPASVVFLGEQRWPPARALLDAGVAVALATDLNPGSSMCDDLPLQTTFACARMGMSPREALRAITSSAAKALRMGDEVGSIVAGKRADVVVLDATHEEDVPYRFGQVRPFAVVAQGRVVLGPGRGLAHGRSLEA